MVAELREAFLERLREAPDGDARLAGVLRAAAVEARSAGMLPEHLLIALKRLSDDMEQQERTAVLLDLGERRRLREWLLQVSIKAYFGD